MRKREKGFSVMEMMIVVLLMSVVALIFYELLDGAMDLSLIVESHNDLITSGQRAINNIQTEVHQAKMLFQDNTLGNEYRNALDIPTSVPVWGGTTTSKMPVFDDTGELVPDSGTGGSRRVGNCFLIARHLPPVSITYDADNDGTDDTTILADEYRFQFYYISTNTQRSFFFLGYYLDLVEAKSDTYADYFQLSNLDATNPSGNTIQQQVAAKLFAQGVRQAWNPGQEIDSAFYGLVDGGVSGTPVQSPTIKMNAKSLFPEFRGGRVSGRIDYSIAFVPELPTPPFAVKDRIPLYAQQDGDFPGGLEFLVVGPSGSRKVLSRLVLVSRYKAGKMDSQENFVITSSKS